jgi:hypothetical protein
MRYLRSKRGRVGLGVLAAIASVTLLVVLPALASSAASPNVPSTSSPGGVVPTTVAIGGNATCSNVFNKVAALPMLQTAQTPTVPNSGTGSFSSGGITFGMTVTNAPQNAGQRLAITSNPLVAIAGVAVNGGTNNAAYDYTGLDFGKGVLTGTGWVSSDGNLSAPAKNSNQTYTMSHLTICYRPLASISGTVIDAGSNSPLGGDAITIVDNQTNGTTTLNTGNDGTFSSPQPIGDTYTICAAVPGGYPTETAPKQGDPATTSCGANYAPVGYSRTLTSGGSPGNNFSFQSLRTISGKVYSDNNLTGTYDPGSNLQPNDALLAGSWTIQLFDSTVGSAAPVGSGTSSGGSYSFQAPVIPGHSYKLCEVPPTNASASTPWVQTEPQANANVTCTSSVGGVNALKWGASFTGANADPAPQNFGNVVGSVCSNTSTFGGGAVQALMPGNANGCLKPNSFAFAAGTDSNTNKQFASVAVGDPTGNQYAPVVEKIVLRDDLKADGTPTYTGLEYTAGSVSTLTPMASCTVDAGDLMDPTNTTDYGAASSPDFRLAHQYAVLRSENGPPVLPASQTACLISSTISGAIGEPGTLTAYVYATADSLYTTR